MRNKDKTLQHSHERKETFNINKYTKISNVIGSLRHPIGKAGSRTSLSSEDAFTSVKKLKLFIKDSDS